LSPPVASSFVSSFAPRLIEWQRRDGRQALPWQQLGSERELERDAYGVWVAEIMLQQTQVAAVLPYYTRFIERFPTVGALAAASLDDVMLHWSGLGYYSRARNLHAAAVLVMERHGGVLPRSTAELEALPGIGRSTAAAIAAFAYGVKAAILDGNVKRVLARLFAVEGPSSSAATTSTLWALAESLLPERDIERYTQGLMDLGATICTPRNPRCLVCPFVNECRARREDRIDELPGRAPKKASPERRAVLLEIVVGEVVWLERRPPSGIWGGLWSLPEIANEQQATIGARVASLGGVEAIEHGGGFTHAFTHFVLQAEVMRVRLARSAAMADADAGRWFERSRLDEIGLPTPIRRYLTANA
jgi:A/G-specific adenine glycosylase